MTTDKFFRGRGGDKPFLFSVIALSAFGVVAVYSASRVVAKEDYGNEFYFAIKQLSGFLLGLCAMLFTANFDYRRYFKRGKLFYVVGVILLALVFVPFLSVEIYGAKRWINLGFFTVQPSEIAKFGYIFLCADYFAVSPERARTLKGVLPMLLCGGIVCLLIIIEPNMSITVCVGLLMLAMLFAAGMKIKHFLIILIPLVLAIPLLIIIEPYRLKRLSAFINPWASPKGEGYQLLQSLYGLGSGGLFGVGLFNSRQKYRFLPFSESDFILSVIGEELGFVGTALLFLLMLFVVVRGLKIASRCKDVYSYLLTVGVISIYAVQVTVNALVVTGSIPPTGLPLPLISAGNTSLVIFMATFGVIYNVSAERDSLP